MKYIFVTGGVVSSRASGAHRGVAGHAPGEPGPPQVTLQKFDPTSTWIRGPWARTSTERCTFDDGAETDLDLGHYERFTNTKLSRKIPPAARFISRS